MSSIIKQTTAVRLNCDQLYPYLTNHLEEVKAQAYPCHTLEQIHPPEFFEQGSLGRSDLRPLLKQDLKKLHDVFGDRLVSHTMISIKANALLFVLNSSFVRGLSFPATVNAMILEKFKVPTCGSFINSFVFKTLKEKVECNIFTFGLVNDRHLDHQLAVVWPIIEDQNVSEIVDSFENTFNTTKSLIQALRVFDGAIIFDPFLKSCFSAQEDPPVHFTRYIEPMNFSRLFGDHCHMDTRSYFSQVPDIEAEFQRVFHPGFEIEVTERIKKQESAPYLQDLRQIHGNAVVQRLNNVFPKYANQWKLGIQKRLVVWTKIETEQERVEMAEFLLSHKVVIETKDLKEGEGVVSKILALIDPLLEKISALTC